MRFRDGPAHFRFGCMTYFAAVTSSSAQCGAPNVAEKQFLERIAQPSNCGRQWQPFDRDDVLHQVSARSDGRLHMPELHDLRPAADTISEGTEEFAHAHIMPGLFHHLAAGASERTFL